MKPTNKLFILVCSIFTILIAGSPTMTKAQTPACGTDEIQKELLRLDPAFKRTQERVESETYKKLKEQKKNPQRIAKSNVCGEDNEEIYQIPVVIHVMHLPEDSIPGIGSNLSTAQIQAGLDHMNQAYRNQGDFAGGPYHSTASTFGVESEDVKIKFVLAKRDPAGNATDGINRISTTYSNLAYADAGPSGFSSQDTYLKSLSFWDSHDYTNVWLVNEICKFSPDSICGVAGYAYLAGAHGSSYDGIVNEARYWGSSPSASKVHIHEFGHYLNLYHTFNDPDGSGSKSPCDNGDCLSEGDYVCDTPPDNSSSAVNCNTSGTANTCSTDADDTSSNNPFSSDVDDLYENYMDYGYQSCQNTFTQGQKDRMRLSLTAIRGSLLSSKGLLPVSTIDAETADILSPSALLGCETITPSFVLRNQGNNALTSAKIAVSIDGVFQYESNWSGNLATQAQETVNLNPIAVSVGIHYVNIYLNQINGAATDDYAANDTVTACFEIYDPVSTLPYCEDFESGSGSPQNWVEENVYATDLWARHSGGGCSSSNGGTSYFLDNWNSYYGNTGADVDLYLSSLDLSGLTDAKLSFSRSYKASYNSRQLELELAISTDCGLSFQTLQSWNNSQLATSAGNEYSVGWVPNTCADWSMDSLDLSSFVGQTVLIRFRAKIQAYYAQNLYLDNICVTSTTPLVCNGLNLSTGQQDETCEASNGNATVQAASGTAPFTYQWSTQPAQNGHTATGLAAGNYQVIVTDANGCQDTALVSIQNDGNPPVAGFNFLNQELLLTISNTSSSSLPQSFSWDFGDGNTSTDTNPTHTYQAPGSYKVCLMSTNDCGTDTLCRTINISCLEPDANYTYTADKLSLSFSNGSIRSESHFWDFGDGHTSTDINPQHTYTLPGTYTVCLTGTSICGSDSICKTIQVICPSPVAAFSTIADDLSVTYNDQSSGASLYMWDFGEGGLSTSPSPAHTYDLPGIYTVCQVVINDCGQDTLCQEIEVTCPAPEAGFSFTRSELSLSFINSSTPGVIYNWDFGDGNTSKDFEPVHTFDSSGVYTISLQASTVCGSDTSIMEVDLSETTGIAKKNLLSVKVYPNPSSGIFYLEVEELQGETVELSIRDLRGRLILSKSFYTYGSTREAIDLKGQTGGVYFLSLRAGEKWFVQKINLRE